ncbi:MAG: DUF4367 domain-containing protein [Oscillospiraceae bacterium]
MNTLSKKDIISRVLSEDPADTLLSAEELEAMLDKELSKPESEIDFGLVNELSAAVNEALEQNTNHIDVESKLNELKAMEAAEKRRFRMPKWSVGLIAACLVLVFGNIYTVNAWNMNVFSFIVEFTKDGAVIDFSNRNDEINIPVSDDDPYGILAVCRENGINIETPYYLPDGFELTTLQTEPDERYVCMTYKRSKRDKAFISMTFQPYIDHIFIPSDENNFSEIQINGHSAIMSREDNQMIVVFGSGDSMLTLMTQDVDYDECDKIISEIR